MQPDLQTAKPELRATEEASTTPVPQVVTKVADALGDRLTCYIAGIKDVRTLARWQQRGDVPGDSARRLQGALRAIILLSSSYRPDQIAPWFTWLNDGLDDRSPAAALHSASTEDDLEATVRAVSAAARARLADE
jgi:hypothetical protein